MYPNSMLFGAIFAVIFLACMAIGVLVAIKKGFFPSLLRLATLILSFIASVPLSLLIAGKCVGLYEKIMLSVLGDALNQIAQHSPSTMDLLLHLPAAIIAPALFITIFYVLSLLTKIICRLLKVLLPSRSGLTFRILGGVAGALSALICLLAIAIPVWGTVSTVHRAVDIIAHSDTSKNQQLDSVVGTFEKIDADLLGPLGDNFVADIFTEKGDSALFRKLTQFEFHQEKLSLSEEITLLSQTASDALALASSLSDEASIQTPEQFSNLRTLASDVDHSKLLRNISAEWLSAITTAWQKGETFMGIEPLQVNASAKPFLNALYGYLSTTNEDRIANDLNCFIDILEILNRHGILDGDKNANMLTKIGNEAFVQDLTAFLDDNDRLRITIADLLSAISGAWQNGEDYESIKLPKTNELFDPVMNTFFGILATTDDTLITDDMTAVSNIIGVLEEYDLFDGIKQGTDMANIIMEGAFVSDLQTEINSHPRFVPLLDTVTALGLSAISSQLNISLPDSETLTQLADTISSTLNTAKDENGNINLDTVSEEVQKTLKENKVDVPDSVTGMIAQVATEKFADQETVSEQEVKDHLLSLYGSAGDLDGFFQ